MDSRDRSAIQARIREIIKMRHPGTILTREHLGGPATRHQGGFLPLLALGATALAPAVGSLINYGVKKLTGQGVKGSTRQPTAWNLHVRAVRMETGLTGKQLLRVASQSYTKQAPKERTPRRKLHGGAILVHHQSEDERPHLSSMIHSQAQRLKMEEHLHPRVGARLR